jgi:hypothetical protein
MAIVQIEPFDLMTSNPMRLMGFVVISTSRTIFCSECPVSLTGHYSLVVIIRFFIFDFPLTSDLS